MHVTNLLLLPLYRNSGNGDQSTIYRGIYRDILRSADINAVTLQALGPSRKSASEVDSVQIIMHCQWFKLYFMTLLQK